MTEVTRLTRAAWAMTGKPVPVYPRRATPVTFVRWDERDGPPPRLP